MLDLIEIDVDERVIARLVFDVDDFDAAIAELDARYLAGEGAAHAHTWSVITKAYAATQQARIRYRHQDWVDIDHRRWTASRRATSAAYVRRDLGPRAGRQRYVSRLCID